MPQSSLTPQNACTQSEKNQQCALPQNLHEYIPEPHCSNEPSRQGEAQGGDRRGVGAEVKMYKGCRGDEFEMESWHGRAGCCIWGREGCGCNGYARSTELVNRRLQLRPCAHMLRLRYATNPRRDDGRLRFPDCAQSFESRHGFRGPLPAPGEDGVQSRYEARNRASSRTMVDLSGLNLGLCYVGF
ncbi:hypothetical protein KC19_2G238500 [Ceratodon purpureus]|uniref:Uncharacterized protein n=1 Tax=Ceratodon purpureus TaxID=3225 RepID=A0A8T0J028_CERPU|nr:hypothetical protein KC19_2G238500 [Ceratodon purpureus]